MAHRIVRQPDGLFAVFSTVVGGLVVTDATRDELAEWYAREAAERARERARVELDRVLGDPAGRQPGALTWEEAARRDRARGFRVTDDERAAPASSRRGGGADSRRPKRGEVKDLLTEQAERWLATADPAGYRDASDGRPAPLRAHPDPYDEPMDFGAYTGPHGYLYVSPTLAVCLCGWHPWNHPGFTVIDHLTDWGVPLRY